jgi:hypothetical protein
MLKIESIKVVVEIDIYPDTSFLGEYTDGCTDWAISRAHEEYVANLPDEEDLHMSYRHEYHFFLPYAGGETPGSEDYQKYGMQDYKRMEGLSRGDWQFVGIGAEAVVSYPITPDGSKRLERLTSGFLWGIESDSGDYLREVAQEQLAELRDHLEVFGVNTNNFLALAEEALDEADI